MQETNNTVTFTQYDKPNLEAGTYTIHLEQKVAKIDGGKDASFNQRATFKVKGERFQLPP